MTFSARGTDFNLARMSRSEWSRGNPLMPKSLVKLAPVQTRTRKSHSLALFGHGCQQLWRHGARQAQSAAVGQFDGKAVGEEIDGSRCWLHFAYVKRLCVNLERYAGRYTGDRV